MIKHTTIWSQLVTVDNMEEKESIVFNLKEVGYTDLEGNKQIVPFDQKDFANALFNNAKSIDMDSFARALHKDGRAEMNEQVAEELLELAPRLWVYRAASAVQETINNIKIK